MSHILKPICTGVFCLFCVYTSIGQFAFSYDGPDTLFVGDDCTAILDWGHPETPDVFPTMPGQVIISWMIFSISGGYMIGDPVPAGETVTVFYQARDNMGHIALFGFNIYFADNDPPEFDQETLPEDVTVECAGDVPLPQITFSDNCDSDTTMTTLSFQESGDADVCAGGVVERIWTITDAFGNAVSFVQEITVLPDTSHPVITGIPVDGTAECGNAMDAYTAWLEEQRMNFMADDIGCGISSLSDNAPDASVLLGFCGELQVAFFAADSCGNTTSVLASFFVTNDTPPDITMEAMDAMVSCASGNPMDSFQDWLNSQGGAQAVDDCSLVSWSTNPVDPSLDDVCNAALTVTFIADDGCGNTASTTAEFFVQDNTAPTITMQAQNMVINCSTSDFEEELAEWLGSHGNAAAQDLCTEVDSLEVTFVLNGVELDSAGVIDAFQDSIMNGNCVDGVVIDGFIWNNVLALITLNFVFTDNCGNSASSPGIFAIRDVLGPTWNVVSQDSILTCAGGDVEALFTEWYQTGGFAQGSDDCGSIYYTGTPSFDEALALLNEGLDTACASGVTIEVAFQLNDFCGNTNPTIESASFGIVDSAGAVLIQEPVDLLFMCEGNVQDALQNWLDTLGGAQVQDACGNIDWMFSWTEGGELLSGEPGAGPYPGEDAITCNSALEVTFSATDICENTISAAAQFSFIDTIAPTLLVDSLVTASCDSLEFIEVEVSDNCTENPVVTFTDVNMSGDTTLCLSGTILRRWRATDDCGNTVTVVQEIHTSDSESPTFISPPDTIIFCTEGDEIEAGFPSSVMDNCDADPDITYLDSITGGACDMMITRKWIVTDACMNVRTSIQEIGLIDTLPPTVLVPPVDLVLECNAEQSLEAAFTAWISNGGSLQDNCSNTQYFFALPGSYSIDDTATWPGNAPLFPELVCGNDTLSSTGVDFVYADACGNAGRIELNVLIVDTQPPVLEGCLSDTLVVLEAGKCETEVVLSPPRAFDVCRADVDSIIVQLTQLITSGLPGDSMAIVDTLVFPFNVQGPPAFAFAPVTIRITLNGVDADSLSEHFILLGDDDTVLGTTGNTETECDTVVTTFNVAPDVFNTWAIDGAINLTLAPNAVPGGEAAINDICPGATAAIELMYTQGIQDSLMFAYSVDTLPAITQDSASDITVLLYAGEHDVTWYFTDCAGHTSQCTTHVTVLDMNVPQIICPADISILLDAEAGCTTPVTLHRPEASDTCGINIMSASFRISGDTAINETLFGVADSLVVFLDVGNYVAVYTVADLSGNTASCSFAIAVHDPIAPVAICQPGIAYVHPSGEIPLVVDPQIVNGGSTDNCQIDSLIVVPGIFTCDSAGTEQLVELIVFDASGNADTCIAALQIEVEALQPSYTVGICAVDTLRLFANAPATLGAQYTFEWSGPNGFSSQLENPMIPGVNATHSGVYTVVVTGAGGCTSTGSVQVEVDETNAPFLSVESSIVCEDESVVLLASVYNQPVTYRWFRGVAPGGLLLGSTMIPVFGDTPPLPGQYSYYLIVETENCSSNPSEPVVVEVVTTPVATVQEPFIDVCEGGSFSLGTDIAGSGIEYSWTGPDGFMSDVQFPPAIIDVTSAHAGVYSLVISVGSCVSAPATTNVVVSPRPDTPEISGDSIFCEGGNLILTVSNIPPADQYIWTNPEMNSISTTGNTLTLDNISSGFEGEWTVVAILGNCPSESSLPFIVNIEEMLPVIASNDGPVCDGSGDSVTLFVTVIPGVDYIWEGPNGFTSTDPNPTVLGIAGTYTVTATSGSGCTAIASTEIIAEDPPGITALSNTAGMCADSSQSLSFAVTVFPPDNGAYDYQWTGPGGFTSDLMNPVIPGLTSDLNGIYTLVVSLGSCASQPVSTEVNVQDAPPRPGIDGVLEYCSGESILLTASEYASDSVLYIWNTPVGNIEIWNDNTLMISNGTVTHGGLYSVIAQIDGCDSPPSEEVMIVIAQVVSQPVVTAQTTLCTGDTLRLMTPFVQGGVYHWTGPNGFVSSQQNPVIANVTLNTSGSYQVQVQVGECISDLSLPLIVTVLPLPLTPVTELFEGSVCLGTSGPLTVCITPASFTAGAEYTWTFQGTPVAPPTDMRCITLDDLSSFNEGIHVITVNASLDGCMASGTDAVEIPMFEIPEETADAGPDATYCANEEVSLNADSPSTGTAVWSSPDAGIVFEDVNDPSSGVSQLSEGENVLIWSLSYESCVDYSFDTVVVTIESTPVAVRDSILVPFGQTVIIPVLSNDQVSGGFTLEILPGGPLKGNALYTGQGNITYDPNLGYVGPDLLTYEICSEICPDQCTTAEVIIQVGNETDCFIPTIFTPNNDGTNDLLIIPCLETDRFPDNRIAIFNEWGDAVFEAQPYANDWDGTRDGKDLPVATYFYIIDFGDGRPVQNGFLILER